MGIPKTFRKSYQIWAAVFPFPEITRYEQIFYVVFLADCKSAVPMLP